MLLTLEAGGRSAAPPRAARPPPAAPAAPARATPAPTPPRPGDAAAAPRPPRPPRSRPGSHLVVVGAGPGGYTAAFRAADLGLKTILVERYPTLGGVCLNVGCIPSKALLHAARVIAEAEEMADHGVTFGKPKVDLTKLLGWKQDVVDKLTGGLAGMAKQRKVEVVTGVGQVHRTQFDARVGDREITFDNCIIAAGSSAVRLPFMPDDPRVIDSTGALSPDDIPKPHAGHRRRDHRP